MEKVSYLIILLIGVVSCSKDNSSVEGFVVGKIAANSVYKEYNPPKELKTTVPSDIYDWNYAFDSIDIDNDGLIDFILLCSNYKNEIGYDQSVSVNVFNKNFEIAFEVRKHSYYYYTFTFNDTSYYVTLEDNRNYEPPTNNYTFTEGNSYFNQPIRFREGLNVNTIFDWANFDMYFVQRDSFTSINSSPNTIIINNTIKNGDWSGFDPKYMVVKLHKNKLVYYGWIKVEVVRPDKVLIYETYFQNNGFED